MRIDRKTIQRLRQSIMWSERQKMASREADIQAKRERNGPQYGTNSPQYRVPLNFIELYETTMRQNLVSSRPRFLCTSKYRAYKRPSLMLELALDSWIEETFFKEVAVDWVVGALYGPSFVKVGVSSYDGDDPYMDRSYDQPYVDWVSPDNLIIDMGASSIRRVAYLGDRYRLPLHEARELFGSDIKPTTQSLTDRFGQERVRAVTQDSPDNSEYREYVDLMDLYLPDYGTVLTLEEWGDDEPLFSGDWNGPRGGPYIEMPFGHVPGQVLPVAPVSVLLDQHRLVNDLFCKIAAQAQRQKSISVFPGGTEADMARVNESRDGTAVRVDGQPPTEISYGGPHSGVLAFLLQCNELFSYFGGNLNVMAGLSQQASTLGQEELLSGNSSKRIQAMQEVVVDSMRRVGRAVSWYIWNDPRRVWRLTTTIPKTDFAVDFPFGPDQRGGPLPAQVDVDPYSLRSQSPESRLRSVMELWNAVILPAMPMMAQQGVTPDFRGFVELIARYRNMNELDDILIRSPQGPVIEGGEEANASGRERSLEDAAASMRPASTNRTYTRVNKSVGNGSPAGDLIAKLAASEGGE